MGIWKTLAVATAKVAGQGLQDMLSDIDSCEKEYEQLSDSELQYKISMHYSCGLKLSTNQEAAIRTILKKRGYKYDKTYGSWFKE